MFDGELMRTFFNPCEVFKSLLVMARTQRDSKQAHSSMLIFYPLHTSTSTNTLIRTHAPASLLQSLTFPSHTSTLFCSAQLCVVQGSCLGYNQLNWRRRTLNPLLLSATLSTALPLGGERGGESNAGRKRTSHHLCKLLYHCQENLPMISNRLRKGGEKEVAVFFCMQSQIYALKNNACFISADKCHIKRTTEGVVPNSWGIACRDVE